MKRKFKKVFSLLLALMMMATLGVTFFASATDTSNQADVAVSAMKEGLAEVTSTLSIGNILTVILAVLGICVGFMFFWWGLRKIIGMAKRAFTKGKVSV